MLLGRILTFLKTYHLSYFIWDGTSVRVHDEFAEYEIHEFREGSDPKNALETLWGMCAGHPPITVGPVPIVRHPLERVTKYLEEDRKSHMGAPHQYWALDPGKLSAALSDSQVWLIPESSYEAFSDLLDFLDEVLSSTPNEAHDLLVNSGEDVLNSASAHFHKITR